jgi:DNA topoisomerase 2-associated protein PAT1
VESTTAKPVGKDFDFFGQTAKVSNAIGEEQLRFNRQQPPPKMASNTSTFVSQSSYTKPARSGYERYKDPGYLPDLQADATLWGDAPKKSTSHPEATTSGTGLHATAGPSTSSRKMMSLEEVEAAMRAQAKKPAQPQPIQEQQRIPERIPIQYSQQTQQQQYLHQSQELPQQFLQAQQTSGFPEQDFLRHTPPVQQQQPMQILQRSRATPTQPAAHAVPSQPQPIQILQNPNRLSGEHQRQAHIGQPAHQGPVPGLGPRHPGPVTHPQQLSNLTDEERAAFLAEDAKRAKRNHKIFLLSKDNGLMTPQDKNFITRIQLQQLVTATGNPNEHGTDAALSEDFYYQVHNQIRGGPRQHPNQPLSNFAQTYLFQTGGRHGGMRRQARGGDNHMQRMEQQVQRAVEAAKNKPKNKQLVIEGSLGKISFSNAKTPKPLLNIKRSEGGADINRPGSAARVASERKIHQAAVSGNDRKTVLRDIENVYNILMKMEDHERQRPPLLSPDEINPPVRGMQIDWDAKWEKLNEQLWQDLKVHEPIGATATHPFIAFLSFSKGKKAIPRVFRQITQQQRTTIMTMIVVHLDQLDVVRQAQLVSGETQLTAGIRENVDLFSMVVMPSLFGYLSEAGLDIVEPILGLLLSHTNVDIDARTRIGVSMLTMILSRAELIKQAGAVNEDEWEHWYVASEHVAS